MISTLAKQNDDFSTEKLNISRPSLNVIIHQPLKANNGELPFATLYLSSYRALSTLLILQYAELAP